MDGALASLPGAPRCRTCRARAITVGCGADPDDLSLSVYAEILVTTNGGPGYASTNLPFLLVYREGAARIKIGQAAGGIIAVVLANIASPFVMRAPSARTPARARRPASLHTARLPHSTLP